MKRELFPIYLRYERYLVSLIFTLIFCTVSMWAAKRIFDIYLPFTTWKTFLDSVVVLSFLFSILSGWFTMRSDRSNALQLEAARKEERVFATLEKHSLAIARLEVGEKNLSNAIATNAEGIEDVRSLFGRLSAQVEQTEAEAILKREIVKIKERIQHLP